jgi:DNA-binding CsgD family transcriptional regulator
LDSLLAGARSGEGRALVLRGEAGIGKSALLEHLVPRAEGCRVARATGIEAEQELAYAGLHQLCAPFLDRLDRLPAPQRDALRTAFGLDAGERPDRFLVGLALLTLLAEVAEEAPLLCLIDDAQWLDRVSAQALAFVARRLLAESIALVLAVRDDSNEHELDGLPELIVPGLSDADARRLLGSALSGPMDERVRDRIIAETHGNPLALLELPRVWTEADLGEGFARPAAIPLAGRIEQGFLRRLELLPADTRRLLLTAAAEPLGDTGLLWAAAGRLGLGADPAAAALATGLIEFSPRVRFKHSLVRSAVYRSAAPDERHDVHRALAEVTDPDTDPDRRAWHRARATVAPEEDVAAELESAADRARARGGQVAAAAFLEQAAVLTPDPARRAERELAAARVRRDTGALDAAVVLLAAVENGPPDPRRGAEALRLRGQIAFDQRNAGSAARLLRSAADQLAPLHAELARETYLEALTAAVWAGSPDQADVVEAAKAASTAPPAPVPPRAVDLILDALATRFTEGWVAAAPLLSRAVAALHTVDEGAADAGRAQWLAGNRVGGNLAGEVWDYEAGVALAERQIQVARDNGALVQLQPALNFLANNRVWAGDLAAADALIAEDRLIAEVTGHPPFGHTAMLLAAFRGESATADALAAVARDAAAAGQGRIVAFSDYASAVLHNGLGEHDRARDAARRVFEADIFGYRTLVISELAEAASRTGDGDLLAAAARRSAECALATPTLWSRGIDARLRALTEDGDVEARFAESIELLGQSPLRVELARSRLLFGEWLRREGRRVDARDQLRTAHDLLGAMGLDAFAERARRELLATGETARKRVVAPVVEELTPQEFQIARLAREGFSNPEIGTRLFLSPRTVEWHLRKVFSKLEISSRRQLRDAALAAAPA